ncbi:OmpA family protein [Lewinella sp. 4G2]|uniref:OmpA family protein n=1 Tax=Lewinella sp. 4G2 TaxID=1803372 RepID=UPI0007B47D94|nr:OmpA family protein [Lewinella sp. 4G2]OAV42892.1 hypothetical protein A3850_016850 [Lewinella sp. 4G2]
MRILPMALLLFLVALCSHSASANETTPTTLAAGMDYGGPTDLRKDTDGDGIRDRDDDCPTEAGPASTNGCPDTDEDGVADHEDECPNLPGTEAHAGCPDRDRDGLVDSLDRCPNHYGPARFSGCPDTDGDGIANPDDKCPREFGLAATKGCPDGDGDGIIDRRDQCPGEYGLKRFQGCPDRDNDGLPDEADRCPDLPGNLITGCPDADEDGTNDADDECPDEPGPLRGCPDTDGDKVADWEDNCPRKSGPALNGGCPDVQFRRLSPSALEQLRLIGENIKFETGSSELSAASSQEILDLAEVARRYPNHTLVIKGHTDDVGDDEKNTRISQERADACRDLLLAYGFPEDRVRAVGYGGSTPVADNSTAAGRARNRRVTFELLER